MEEKMKQRLIGVIVIIGALFIILPFLFHNSRPSADSKLSADAPATPNVSVTLPAASTTSPATNANSPVPADTTTQPAATSPAQTTASPAAAITPDETTTTPAATTPAATTQTPTSTQTPTPATPTPATPTPAAAPFSAAPGALTTGQPNETPAPAAQPATASPAQPTSQAQPVVKKRVVIKRAVVKKMPVFGINNAFEIQLAVFSDKAYANELVTKLRSHHFDVYSRAVVVDQRHLVAVFVGPEIDLNKAQMLQRRLKQEFHLNGVVKKYQA